MGTKMSRMTYPSISDIVGDALRAVHEDEQAKHAAAASNNENAPPAIPRTALAGELHKLAAVCRKQRDDVTYEDLREFLNAK